VQRDGKLVTVLQPEKRLYRAQNMPLSQAAIDSGMTRDLFVALGDAVNDKTWTLRIQVKPFMNWIWGGCLLMALGGFLALADRRYRAYAARRVSQAATASPVNAGGIA
jgi:cytochrome c-type biogenesis protein CcmF